MEREESDRHLTLGAAAAAILSACFGCFVIGAASLLGASSSEIRELLTFYEPVGSLSGESTVGIIAWLVSWTVLHPLYKNRQPDMVLTLLVSFGLLLLALILTFPPVLQSLATQ